MSNKILLPVILSGYRPRNDGSWSITLSTNILKSEEKVIIDSMHQQLCCVMLKDSEIKTDEIEIFDSVDMDLVDTKKTPSKRLSNIFYLLWKQEGEQCEFKDYYKTKMEILCEHFKNKLL